MPKLDRYTAGDTLPVTFTLPGVTVVAGTIRFRLRNRATLNTDYDVNCPVTFAGPDATADWQPTGLEVAGEYDAELEVTFSSGKKRSWPDEDEGWVFILRNDYG